MKLLELTQNHKGTFLHLHQFAGAIAINRIWCKECGCAKDAFKPNIITQRSLLPPQDLALHSFCASCGWMYEKKPIPRALRLKIERLDNEECVYCGLQKTTGRKFGLDHLTPEIEGGKNTVQNLVFCCQTCNSEKGRKGNFYKPKFGRFKSS